MVDRFLGGKVSVQPTYKYTPRRENLNRRHCPYLVVPRYDGILFYIHMDTDKLFTQPGYLRIPKGLLEHLLAKRTPGSSKKEQNRLFPLLR